MKRRIMPLSTFQPSRHGARVVALASLCVAGLIPAAEVRADTTWIGTTNVYTTTTNWTAGLPSNGNQLAIFSGTASSVVNVDLNGTTARNTLGIRFDNAAGSNGFTFTGSSTTPGFQILAGGSVNGIVNNDADTQTFGVPITLFSNTGVSGSGASQTWNAAAGNLVFTGTYSSTRATVDNNGGTITITGAFDTTIGTTGKGDITGSGGLTKSGTGTLTLGGNTGNSYTGATVVNAGTVELKKSSGNAIGSGNLTIGDGTGGAGADVVKLLASNQIHDSTAVTIASSGTLNLNNNNDTIGSLASTGSSAVVSLGTGSLTVGGNNSSTTYAGDISGSNLITKAGTGTWTLTTTAHTFTGKTVVTGGFIAPGGDDRLGVAPGSVVADQLKLDGGGLSTVTSSGFTMAVNRGITVTANNGTIQTVSGTTLTLPNKITGPGKVTKTQSGTLTLSGANDFQGGMDITGGTVNFDNNSAAGTGAITVSPASTVTLRNTTGNVTLSNNVTVNASAQVVDLLATSGNSLTFAGKISGDGALTRGSGGGVGVVALTGDNGGWSGGMTLKQGTLAVGHKNALGTGDLVITPGASAAVLRSTAGLTGANAVGNAVTVNGSFTVDGASDIELSGAMTLAAPATVTVTNTGQSIFSGQMTGAASAGFTKSGAGVLTLSNPNNTYAGATTVSQGTLVVNGKLSGGGAVTVGNGGTLGGSGTIVGAVSVSNGGTLAPGNSPGTLTTGTLTLNPTSTYAYQINGTDNTVGGGVNDLTVVSGNLTLDGTVNVSATPGLSASIGKVAYRMFNYTGTLTDGGMAVGTTPSNNFLYAVKTGTPNQVDLEIQQKAKIGSVSSPGATIIGAGVTPVSILVGNSSPTGSAALTFSATNLGPGLFGGGSGTAAPQMTGTGTISYNSAGVAGSYNLGFTVTGDANTTQGGDVNGTTTVTVLDHSDAGFDVNGLKTLTINLGTVLENAGGGSISSLFDVFNKVATAGFTAGLDLDTIVSSGDVATLSLSSPVMFTNLAAGHSQGYTIVFDTTQVGSFSATYTFKLSDQDLLGGTGPESDVITLTVNGTVAAPVPLPASAWMGLGLLGGIGAVRRFRKVRVV